MKTKKKVGAPQKYPWDKWLKKGSSRTLLKGRDFECSTRSMTTYLYTMATSKKVRISVRELGEGRLKIDVYSNGDK